MSTTPVSVADQHNRHGIPMLLLLVLAGLAGNYFKFPIFLNIDFLFGSIFALLALQYLGFGWGVLAAALISSYTYVLWNHPYAIIIMTTEVAAVGWLMRHRRLGMVLADALFWLLLGMPLVYIFYYVVMHLSFSIAYITMAKQAVNGIANALLARLLFTCYMLRSRSSLISYRDIIYNLLTFFVLCPVLALLASASRTDFSDTDRNIRAKLTQDSRRVADIAEIWTSNRKSAIVALADLAGTSSPQQVQPFLELAKRSDANFARIGLLDHNAITVAFFPLFDELGQKNIGKNFADRPYIPQLKRTLQPMLSEVVIGKIGPPRPMVAMLAPVVIHGEYGGYVAGILSLEQVRRHLDKITGPNNILYTLLDKNGSVIMTSRLDQTVMKPFSRGQGELTRLDEVISQWVPPVAPNTSIAERWRTSFYVAETTIGALGEWKLILEQPVAPFQKVLYDRYADLLSRLLLILLCALALAELLSRRILVTLEELSLTTQDLPARLASGTQEFAWPESSIKEAGALIRNFREMDESLSERFREVRRINESLEQRVEERTRALHLESARLQNLLNTATDGIHILDTEGNLVLCSPSFAQMLGYTLAEMDGKNVSDWDSQFTGPELIATLRELMREPRTFETLHRRKDGTTTQVEINAWGVEMDGGMFVYASARDITQRKRLEDDLRRLATTDPLTGIGNRRHFLERAKEELVRSNRYGLPLVFLMLDLDHFKQINDTFGHGVGDEVLRATVSTLQKTLRASDVLGRLGGEEFGALLVQTDLAAARGIAERLRETLQAVVVETKSGPVAFTASIGLAASTGNGDTIEDIMKHADVAMYRGKELGRNRVCCFGEI